LLLAFDSFSDGRIALSDRIKKHFLQASERRLVFPGDAVRSYWRSYRSDNAQGLVVHTFARGLGWAMSEGESGEASSDEDDMLFMCGLDIGEGFEDATEDESCSIREPLPIKRVEYDSLSAEDFEQQYFVTNQPVILTKAEEHVPMFLTTDYLNQKYGERPYPLNFDIDQKVLLSKFLAFDCPELRQGYLRNLQMARFFPKELHHLHFPSVFGYNFLSDPTGVRDKGYPPEYTRWFELFINTADCQGFPFLHKDTCHSHAFTMQIGGIKKFVMFAPSDGPNLYPSSVGLEGNRSTIASKDILLNEVDLQQFPKFKEAQAYSANLYPGEILFIPSDWWHTTYIVGKEPSVSLGGNFVVATNKEAFDSSWGDFRQACNLVKSGVVSFNDTATSRGSRTS
jgi:hypothetical protein